MSDGTILVEGSAFATDIASGRARDMPWFRFSSDGSLLGSLPGVSPGRVVVMEALPMVVPGVSIPQDAAAMVPYSRTAWVAIVPDGSGVVRVNYVPSDREPGKETDFHVVRLSLDGDTVASRSLPYTPVRTPSRSRRQR